MWIPIEAARNDSTLISQCASILQPVYENCDAPLDYALWHEGNRFYHEHDPVTGRLRSFFVGQTPRAVHPLLPFVGYMGLVAQSSLAPGAGRRLWSEYVSDMRHMFENHDVLVWYRTATPFGLFPCYHLLEDGEPRRDGSYSGQKKEEMLLIREVHGIPYDRDDHPFVVRGLASARYTEAERERMRRYSRAVRTNVLESLRVDELRGDRLLMLGSLSRSRPETPR